MPEVVVTKLDPAAKLPSYATDGDAGADLSALVAVKLPAGGGRALVPTGIAIALPPGTAGFVQPRSGLALKHGVTVLNSPGLIDAGYRGEIKVNLINLDPANALTLRPPTTCRAAIPPPMLPRPMNAMRVMGGPPYILAAT